MEETEQRLLERARGGDRIAYGALVRRHQRRIFACSVHILGDAAEAEDATQETFLRAWKALARFDGRSELSTWLYRICINVCLNTIRRRRRLDPSDVLDPSVASVESESRAQAPDPAVAADGNRLFARLAAALEELSPSLRTTVVLVLIQGLPHRAAAQVLGCPEGTIAWRVHEARKLLRERLADVLHELRDSAPGPQARANAREAT